jgi:hypothetical protein
MTIALKIDYTEWVDKVETTLSDRSPAIATARVSIGIRASPIQPSREFGPSDEPPCPCCLFRFPLTIASRSQHTQWFLSQEFGLEVARGAPKIAALDNLVDKGR